MQMKTQSIKSIALVISAGLIFGCSNKKLEERVQSLEKRVAQLEKGNPSSISGNTPSNLTSTSVEQAPDGKLPEIKFEQTEYDFGTVSEGDIVNHTYTFTNTGEAPLVIKQATASCGCTVPQWPKEPIAPGETGKIEVKFDSKGRTNKQTKTITITANTDPTVSRLKLFGMVNPDAEKSNEPS